MTRRTHTLGANNKCPLTIDAGRQSQRLVGFQVEHIRLNGKIVEPTAALAVLGQRCFLIGMTTKVKSSTFIIHTGL